jgi:protein-S-isoprenylcysteine O-methyltransferase Ste14
VAVLLPWLVLLEWKIPESVAWNHWLALPVILSGISVLLRSVSKFATQGKGTLSPADPAKRLVVNGLYRYVRNPMYIGVLMILLGEALFFRSGTMFFYTAVVFVVFNLFIRFFEEPYLKKTFGEEYERYYSAVNRWIPGKPYSSRQVGK